LIGKTLNHYQIVALVGKGGMGEVYVALDTKLHRRVALKILSPETASSPDRRRRFESEARAVATLNHPSIVTIHSIEEDQDTFFLTMELVEGKTLAELIPEGGMDLEALLEVAVPLADALGAAHERGVIHKDIKPANVMLDSNRRVKVLDFGLAKLRQEEPGPDAILSSDALPTATQAGTIAGTVSYMSPEQLEGKSGDHRTDIFSFGVVLYELATGQRPFLGESPAALISSILRDSPEPMDQVRPDLPRELARIIARCLEKTPERRWATAGEMGAALRSLSSSGPGATETDDRTVFRRPAVAVLPFANLSGDPEQEYFADGMTQDIITALSYWRWFPVIARNSTLAYKGKAVNVMEVGRELGAGYVVEGTVRKVGEKIRITAQLADASTGHQVWSQRYDRQLTDVFALQDEITECIVSSIEPELSRAEQQRALRKPPENLDAWSCCQRAMAEQWKTSQAGYTEAIRLLREAIDRDPNSSFALSMLANCIYEQTMAGWSDDPQRSFGEVLERASRSVELDDGDWLGHHLKGLGFLWTQRDYDSGIAEGRRAIALNPSAASAYHGSACVLTYSGNFVESIPALHTVLRLDPHYRFAGSALADLSLSHMMEREFDQALEFAEKAVRTQPGFVRGHQRLACCLGHLGREEEARAALKKLMQRQPDFSLQYVEATYPFRQSEDLKFFLDGLRVAGFDS